MASQILHSKIDKFGRIVLPKEIRDSLGVRTGTEFEVEEFEDKIVLKPVQKKAQLIEKNGWLVIASDADKDTDIVELIRKDREERARKVGGW